MSISANNYVDLVDGKFKNTTAAQMDAAFAAMKGAGAKHLVVNFHGGLVPRKSAIDSIEKVLFNEYSAAGAWPYFFVWNSDIVTTARANLDEIAQEPAFKQLLRKMIELVSAKLVDAPGRGLLQPDDIPFERAASVDGLHAEAVEREEFWRTGSGTASELTPSEELTIERELASDTVLKKEALAIASGLLAPAQVDAANSTRGAEPVLAPRRTHISPQLLQHEFVEQQQEQGTRGVVTLLFFARHGMAIAKRVVTRFVNKRDHGLFSTIVEEILRELYVDNLGVVGWGTMKKDTADAFSGDEQEYGGARFGNALAEAMQADPALRVTLIGHSTGAIYITHLLEYLDSRMPAALQLDVIFLAPALTVSAMAARLDTYKRRVRNFRLFGLADARERGYWEVPLLYYGSLLYMVSGIFEEEARKEELGDVPLVGMQRHMMAQAGSPYFRDEWKDLRDWLHLRERTVWATDNMPATPGYLSNAFKHGQIDDEDPVTLASLVHILKNGFR